MRDEREVQLQRSALIPPPSLRQTICKNLRPTWVSSKGSPPSSSDNAGKSTSPSNRRAAVSTRPATSSAKSKTCDGAPRRHRKSGRRELRGRNRARDEVEVGQPARLQRNGSRQIRTR